MFILDYKVNKRRLFILIMLLITSCTGRTTTDDGLPILKVNDQHLAPENYPGKPYDIPPGKGFALDLAGYKFRIPATLGIDQINSIQIVVKPEQIFQIPVQQSVTLYRVTTDTLIPIGNATPFNGINAGEDITVGVGYTYPDGRFFPAWMGIVSVVEEQP
jgi:hypothetical protein